MLKQHKQPPLNTRLPVPDGAPGTQARRKARAAQARITACKCQRTATPAKKAAKVAPRKAIVRRASPASTDPYQQVLAHDQQKATPKRKTR